MNDLDGVIPQLSEVTEDKQQRLQPLAFEGSYYINLYEFLEKEEPTVH